MIILPTGRLSLDYTLARNDDVAQYVLQYAEGLNRDRPRTAGDWKAWVDSIDLGYLDSELGAGIAQVAEHIRQAHPDILPAVLPQGGAVPAVRLDVESYQLVYKKMGYSEVCMHMGVADKLMWAQLCEHGGAQLYTSDLRPFSSKITAGEAGFYGRSEGTVYTYVELTPLHQLVADMDHVFRNTYNNNPQWLCESLIDRFFGMTSMPDQMEILRCYAANRPWAWTLHRYLTAL